MRAHAVEIVMSGAGVRERRMLDNVVPFQRPDVRASRTAPAVTIERDARPAPVPAAAFSRARLALFVVASLALHAGVFAAFHREAPTLASVGQKSISVEIVLGTDVAAGLAKKPTQSEAAIDSAPAQGEGPELVKPEMARQEIKSADAAPTVTAEPAAKTAPRVEPVAEAKPVERPPAAVDRPVAEASPTPVTVLATPAPAPDKIAAEASAEIQAKPETPPDVKAVTVPPRKPRQVVRRQRNDKGEDARTRQSRASSASVASSGIGLGRSDALSNYRGLVAAQLARNKHFPPDARRNGQEGRAVVSFTIDPGGRVMRVALVRGSGIASLDQEAQAMVNRAAPFPPPPSQQQMRFTVPVTFNIQ